MNFNEFFKKVRKNAIGPSRLLGIDPGGEIGWALFTDGEMLEQGQCDGYEHKTSIINWESIENLLETTKPTHIVCESYHIYAHKLEEHSFSSVPTLQIIGMLDHYCYSNEIPLEYQSANMAKGFCTDDKLKKWGLWQKGQRHSRDAIRHICYYLIFNKKY